MLETPKRDRRAERREATREEILEHAWSLCREQGLHGLSLRELAARVGMKAPSLYSYFDSKHAIYDAMYAQGCHDYDAMESRLLAELAPLRSSQASAAVGAMLRGFVDFCAEDTVRFQLLFQRTIPGFEPSPESFAISEAALGRLRGQLEELGVDGPELLDLLTAIGSGLASQQIANDPGGDRWVRLAETAAEMFVSHARNRATGPAPAQARGARRRRKQR